jgi:hypothetical protein
MGRHRNQSSLIDAAQEFAAGESLQVRQDSFSRDGLYQVKAGSVVMFEYYEPDTTGNWARCMARIGGRDHYVTLPSLNLWRPAR